MLLLISENRRNLRITSSYFAYHVNIKREHDTKIKVIVALWISCKESRKLLAFYKVENDKMCTHLNDKIGISW